jgi:hypothetical protein
LNFAISLFDYRKGRNMANQNFPHGFRPLMVDLAGAPVGVNQYGKASSVANAIFAFDLVKGSATSAPVEGQELPSKGIVPGTVGAAFIGSALNYGAASTNTWHTIVDDPRALFEAQCDSTDDITVAGKVGKNASILATAQSNGSLISAMQVDSSTIAATGTLDLFIRDLYRDIRNAEGANAIVEVLINNHQYANQVAGV